MRSLLILLSLLVATSASAQTPHVNAVGLPEKGLITVDGVLDEHAWSRAEPITDFMGIEPTEGLPPEAPTTVRVLFDDKFIYFGFDCELADPEDSVRGYVAAREDINRDDQVGIYLDPFGDARRAYIFYINAFGVQQDMIVTIDGFWSGAWDALFRSAGSFEKGRYRVEVAIPWRSLKFPKVSDSPWGVRFTRRYGASLAKSSFPFVQKNKGPMLTQLAELRGVEPKNSGIGLELRPSLVLRTGLDRDGDSLAWRKPGFPDTADPSLGVKWQISPSMALDAAINPDFSQIEADPNFIDNNLRFPLFLSERRPFFLEGREHFNGHLLYTRSIVNPLYGLKLSGKVKKVAVAVLHALDETPAPSFSRERATPGFSAEDVDGAMALVSYAGSRLDLPNRSSLGLALTNKELLKSNEHHAGYRGALLEGTLGLDDVSSVFGAVAVSDTSRTGGERIGGASGVVEVWRDARFGGFEAGGFFNTPGYRTENGFNTRSGRIGMWADANVRFEPSVGPADWVTGNTWFDISRQEVDGSIEADQAEIGGSMGARLPALTDLSGWGEGWTTRFGGKDFRGARYGFNVGNRALDWLDVNVNGWMGDAIRYSDASRSFVRNLNVNAGFRAFRRLKLDLSYQVSALGKAGEAMDIDQVYRARLRIGITRAFSLRFIGQGAIDERLDLSALLAFNPSAGTAIFLGYGHRFEHVDGGPLKTTAIDIFLKGTVLIRL